MVCEVVRGEESSWAVILALGIVALVYAMAVL